MEMSKYTIKDWKAVKAELAAGNTIREVAKRTGVDRGTVLKWSHRENPSEWMWLNMSTEKIAAGNPRRSSRKARLTFEDRTYIAAMLKVGQTATSIAKELGVARTTISRELKRTDREYDPRKAHMDADKKGVRPKKRKLETNERLRQYVIEGLLNRWSPEQISKRVAADYPEDRSMRISHETIYQAIYIQGKGSLRQELAVEQALRSGNKRRKPQSKLPPKSRNQSWVEGCEFSTRPPEIQDRAVPGHWEGDLIIGSDMKSCLVTLVERKTRFLIARRLESKDTKTVVDLLIEMAASVPEAIRNGLCNTLTWDQGVEMADAARFCSATGFKVYFCDPHSPWQKGTNENTNGLIRQYFPKGTSFLNITDEQVKTMQDQMNGRPRETLGWKTPSEALSNELIAIGAMIA